MLKINFLIESGIRNLEFKGHSSPLMSRTSIFEEGVFRMFAQHNHIFTRDNLREVKALTHQNTCNDKQYGNTSIKIHVEYKVSSKDH